MSLSIFSRREDSCLEVVWATAECEINSRLSWRVRAENDETRGDLTLKIDVRLILELIVVCRRLEAFYKLFSFRGKH